MLDQVKLLYDGQLYGDVKRLTGMLLTLSDHNHDFLTMSGKYQVLVYQAEAFFHTGDYKKAEVLYGQALQVKKVLTKSKGKSQPLVRPKTENKSQHLDVLSEVEVKYKLHLCMCHNKQPAEAILVLQGIPMRQRSSKINMALAQLHQRTGMDRSAITTYKEVLRECPMSLEAVNGLLSLGVSSMDVMSLVMTGLGNLNNLEWLTSWIKAQAHAYNREYTNAVTTYRILDNKPLLRDNTDLLCSLGESQLESGDYGGALTTLHRAHLLDAHLLRDMDILAFLYMREKKHKDLSSLATKLMGVSETAPEPWVAIGYYCLATKKSTRAIYFAQKAYQINPRCIEALLLKGTALLELKRYQDAILHFGEALQLAPGRYEVHKGRLQCFLASHRMREAISYAGQAYKQLGTNARSLTLYASVLAKEPLSLEKAKSYLEKALKLDPLYLEAVYLMVEILGEQQQYAKAIDLLRQQLRQQSTCQLHQLLADFLSHNNEHLEALDQYSIALRLDPSNKRAHEGVERIEKHSDLGMDSTYDVEVEDITDNEADLDNSDIEDAWSDFDLM